MALKTKGKPAILLLEMLKLTSFSPMAVIMSERQVEDAALRDDAVDGCGGKSLKAIVFCYCWVGGCRRGTEMPSAKRNRRQIVKVEASGEKAG